ncbi:uncharacterized protein LOC126793605 [Argentina anserina]|uniref:uncharacterized protein LOC126793605 n=1 Tax=Argentina anserina TaxID=57926 RepID=UPI002176448D|nr:uncharacterized protein LOC126793605 [Potentilla anserina]
MGGCFSVSTSFEPSLHSSSPTAKVVSVNGRLLEYPVPVAVSQVLKAEEASYSSSSSSAPSFFVCNSDWLNYDEYIPALESDHQLEADQIYFVLPVAKLQRRLTATDMAAFAVRASVALQNASSSLENKDRTRRRKQNRVSPIFVVKSEPKSGYEFVDYEADFTIGPSNSVMKKKVILPEKAAGLGVSRSGSVRKLQRYTSKRVLKRAVRSFKLRLTPIQEGTEVF